MFASIIYNFFCCGSLDSHWNISKNELEIMGARRKPILHIAIRKCIVQFCRSLFHYNLRWKINKIQKIENCNFHHISEFEHPNDLYRLLKPFQCVNMKKYIILSMTRHYIFNFIFNLRINRSEWIKLYFFLYTFGIISYNL